MNAIGETVTPAPAATQLQPAQPGWRPALAVLLLGLAVLLAVFWEEGAAAVRIWDTSTAYNHCWLIAPIAAWLAWQRRHRLALIAPAPAPLLALLAIPPALAWLVAERLGIMEGRQLTAWALAQVFVLICFIHCDTRDEFLRAAKPWKFNLGLIEQKYNAEQKAATKAAATAKGKKTGKAKKAAA